MNSGKFKHILLLLSLSSLFWTNNACCQHIFKGQIIDSLSNSPIPFLIININEGESLLFSDGEGRFSVSSSSQEITLGITSPCSEEVFSLNFSENDTSNIEIFIPNHPCGQLEHTDEESRAIMEKVLLFKDFNDPKNLSHESKIYSKYFFSSQNFSKPKKNSLVRKALNFLPLEFKEKDKENLFLLESTSHKLHLDRFHQKENIEGVKSTGLNIASIPGYIIPFQFFTVYDDYINIGSDEYISPLAGNPFKRYYFKLLYKLVEENDTTYIVQFNPQPKKVLHQAKGLLYIDANNFAIKKFVASDAIPGALHLQVSQQYDRETGFLKNTTTTAVFHKKTPRPITFTLQAKSIFEHTINNNLKKSGFDENIRIYDSKLLKNSEAFWNERRKSELTAQEQAFYDVYDSTGTSKKIERALRFGERLYFGNIPYKKINFDINRFYKFNDAEGHRLGLGLHTNELFSENIFLRGYLGYGFRDKKYKYGVDAAWFINGDPDNHISLIYGRDLTEAGSVTYPYDLVQYSSESIRDFLLRIMDLTTTYKVAAGYSPMRYLKAQAAISKNIIQPTYDYSFDDINITRLGITEIELGLRYAYGERYIKLSRQKIPVASNYPVVWFLYSKGIGDNNGPVVNYNKFDFKLQQTIKTLGSGVTGIQALAGITTGDAPYMRLWNGLGALRKPSIVIHNAFETMGYNEFLSERYAAIFLSHNFGKIFTKDLYFRPELVVSHNMGFGSLRNPERHAGLEFKTMEKGYFESGFFLNKLIVLDISGLKTGIGYGMFFRYGPYRHRYIEDNLVYKLAFTFFI